MAHTKQHFPSFPGVNPPIKTTGYALSNAKGHCNSYGKNLSSGGSTSAWWEPVALKGSVVAGKPPTGGPTGGNRPNAKVAGKGGVSSKG
jgi:hypothetical protein